MVEIKSSEIVCKIAEHGAELKSITKDKKEYMWQADPKYWGRTSPVLFPFVGAVADGVFRHNGCEYPMGQHGFARDLDFELVDNSEDFVLFRLTSNEETKAKYPFDFVLDISYRVSGNSLTVGWNVKNTGCDTMYFSIGAHPAFNCTLKDSKLRLYKGDNPIDRFDNAVFGPGLLTDNHVVFGVLDGYINMDENTFDGDAFVLENNQVDRVDLCDNDGNSRLSVQFDSPLVGLWSPPGKNAPFVCIEPWYGRADKVGYTGELRDREWGNTLAAGEEFKAEYTIEIH